MIDKQPLTIEEVKRFIASLANSLKLYLHTSAMILRKKLPLPQNPLENVQMQAISF